MLPSEIEFIRQCLPEQTVLPYFADRESAWLLARQLSGPKRIAELRKGPLGRFLDRPAVRPVVANCGGQLDPRDLSPLATACPSASSDILSTAALAGLDAAYALPWHDFQLTLATWALADGYGYSQISRPGGNLVLQLGFPSDHASLMGKYLKRDQRKDFEFYSHPVRRSGRPTLAWSRLDIDLDRGEALIEEVQSDWLRFVQEETAYLAEQIPRSRELRVAQAYDQELRRRYGKIWPRAMLLAVFKLLTEDLGCRDIWMHQPAAGAILKGIWDEQPPRSLYSKLPKSMGFVPVSDMPRLILANRSAKPSRDRLQKLDQYRQTGAPIFWHLRL